MGRAVVIVVALISGLAGVGCAAKRPAKLPYVAPSHMKQIEFTKACEPEKDGVHVMCDRVRVTTDGTVEYRAKKEGKDMRKALGGRVVR